MGGERRGTKTLLLKHTLFCETPGKMSYYNFGSARFLPNKTAHLELATTPFWTNPIAWNTLTNRPVSSKVGLTFGFPFHAFVIAAHSSVFSQTRIFKGHEYGKAALWGLALRILRLLIHIGTLSRCALCFMCPCLFKTETTVSPAFQW